MDTWYDPETGTRQPLGSTPCVKHRSDLKETRHDYGALASAANADALKALLSAE